MSPRSSRGSREKTMSWDKLDGPGGGSLVKTNRVARKNWPRGMFAASWNAARTGDLAARDRLLERLRTPVIRLARRFKASHPQADLDELIGLADVELIEVLDRELNRAEHDLNSFNWLLHSRMTRVFERSLSQDGSARRPDGDGPVDMAEIAARNLLDALKVRRHEVLSFDLTRWDAALQRLERRERSILLARHDFITGSPQATYRDLAARMKLSHERVHQLAERACARLRKRAGLLGLVDPRAVERLEGR